MINGTHNKGFFAGTFDFLHLGHLHSLWYAIRNCEQLVVIVSRDTTVLRIKGNVPYYSEQQRLRAVRALNLPRTHVRLGYKEKDFLQLLSEESPDCLFLGYDQLPNFEQQVSKKNPSLSIERMPAYFPEYFKSSKVKSKFFNTPHI